MTGDQRQGKGPLAFLPAWMASAADDSPLGNSQPAAQLVSTPQPQMQTPALRHALQSSQHQPGSSSQLPSFSNPTFSLLSPQP